MEAKKNIIVDGVEYTKVERGPREVVVVDRGWIFAGDVTETAEQLVLTDALHVFTWKGIGFAGMLSQPQSDKVDLRPCHDVKVPIGSVIFRVPVAADWGKGR